MSEPFTRLIRAGQIGPAPRQARVTADAAERAALAGDFGLVGIAMLSGEFSLRREGSVIAATLRLSARVTQTCVVTLDPFEMAVEELSELRFVPAERVGEGSELAALDDAALAAPDELPYGNDQIDLGAALAEQLALTLDPYPRKPGAEFAAAPEDRAQPFALLAARLKQGG